MTGTTDSIYNDGFIRAQVDAEAQAAIAADEKTYDLTTSLDKAFPGLAMALYATAAYPSNPRFKSILGDYLNEKGVVQGRASDKETVTPDPGVLSGEKSYIRPNGDKYYVRKWGRHDDVQVLIKARENKDFVLLYGPPGTGKTAMAEAAFGDDLITVLGTGDTEVTDLIGGFVPTEKLGEFRWVDGPLLTAAKEGKMLLIDEIGLIDTKVAAVIYSFTDGRREYYVSANPEVGTVRAADGFGVIAATNPNAPGVRLSEALLSRATIQVEVTTDWVLALEMGIPKRLTTVGQNMTRKLEANEVSWAPQFRDLLAFKKLEAHYGLEFALANIIATAPEADREVFAELLRTQFGDGHVAARV